MLQSMGSQRVGCNWVTEHHHQQNPSNWNLPDVLQFFLIHIHSLTFLLFRVNPLSEFNSAIAIRYRTRKFLHDSPEKSDQMTDILNCPQTDLLKDQGSWQSAHPSAWKVTQLSTSEEQLGPSLADYSVIDPRKKTGTSDRFLVLWISLSESLASSLWLSGPEGLWWRGIRRDMDRPWTNEL